MGSSTFSKVPMGISANQDIDKKADEFVNQTVTSQVAAKPQKEKTKPLYLRVPFSLHDEICKVTAQTGLSMNAVCLDILRSGIKKKLKDLQNE